MTNVSSGNVLFFSPPCAHTHCVLFSLKYIDLQQQGNTVKEKLEQTVAELEMRLAERENSGDTVAEVRGSPNPLQGNLPVSPTLALFTFSFLTGNF